jgi:hypothetical protein
MFQPLLFAYKVLGNRIALRILDKPVPSFLRLLAELVAVFQIGFIIIIIYSFLLLFAASHRCHLLVSIIGNFFFYFSHRFCYFIFLQPPVVVRCITSLPPSCFHQGPSYSVFIQTISRE